MKQEVYVLTGDLVLQRITNLSYCLLAFVKSIQITTYHKLEILSYMRQKRAMSMGI